jgi:hypothetical protein
MTALLKQLEQMHIRIAETATCEETLVKALAEALNRLDRQLLADVQSIATDHEIRRSAVLDELQGLAGSIGMFRAPVAAVTARREFELDATTYIAPEAQPCAVAGGDWRQATMNIRDDLELPAKVASSVRALFPHERRAEPVSLNERRRRANGE